MHTNRNLTSRARKFRQTVKVALAKRDVTIAELARHVGRHRNSVSRAINRGEFHKVQALISEVLDL